MNGSGLEELLEEVYSEDTVRHIFSCKAVSRALHAHMIAQRELVSHIFFTLVEETSTSQNWKKSTKSQLLLDSFKM